MRVIDASSIVLAWDIYPIDQFPKFWDWVESTLKTQGMVMADPNYDEVGHASPDCKTWLSSNLTVLPVTNAIIAESIKINQALGTVNNNYHPGGVDENDVLFIAMAKVAGFEVITDEAIQASKPQNMQRYKIPAVCNLPSVVVTCTNLNQYIRQSRATF